jgi:hypothetical protein
MARVHETSSSFLCRLLSEQSEATRVRRHRETRDVRQQVPLQRVERHRKNRARSQDTPRTTGQPTRFESTTGVAAMTIHLSLAPLVSLIAGVLILVMPRLLNFIVAIYLIVIGLIGLFGMGSAHF